jgi:hypothetical protein
MWSTTFWKQRGTMGNATTTIIVLSLCIDFQVPHFCVPIGPTKNDNLLPTLVFDNRLVEFFSTMMVVIALEHAIALTPNFRSNLLYG